MNAFMESVSKVFKGAFKTFQTFPAVTGSALGFAIVTMIRIQLDWPQQEPYNLLFNCLHWSFAVGAIFSLAAITAAQSRFEQGRAFLIANLLGVVAIIVTFLVLYLFGGTDPGLTESRYTVLSGLAEARAGAAILISFIAFIILAAYPQDQSDFSRSFFMTHKAFFIALIYGLVLISGLSGVAGAVQALLYHEMSEKVYMYIATLTGFLAFTIFVGYFPDFRKGRADEHREAAQQQPRFVEILFGNIMIPIVLALTAVLLLWAGKTMLTGMGSSFIQLSSIATSYAVTGLWLHIITTHYETGLAKFYRKAYPIAALVILAFEAWALFIQLQKSGLKLTEYTFIVIWIITVASVILLLIWKARAHHPIAALLCAMAVVSVLPVVGYQALPVKAQVSRLETLLISQDMLKGDQLIPAATKPELAVRESITDAVDYLAYAEDAKLPVWFDKRLGESAVFKSKLGFEQAWPAPEEAIVPEGIIGISLVMKPEAVDISDYRWAVNMQNFTDEKRRESSIAIDGDRGAYRINWQANTSDGIPILRIELDDRVILEQDMNDYIDRITAKYPPGQAASSEVSLQDMSLQLETPEVNVLLVFSNIDIYVDPSNDIFNYGLNLNTLYMKEKP